MIKKVFLAFAAVVAVGALVLGAGALASPGSVGVQAVGGAACPVAGCSLDGGCHDYSVVPEPDGVHEMICPEAGCASTECHAWDALEGRYRQASDASLNVWIVLPVVLVLAMVIAVKRLSADRPRSSGRSSFAPRCEEESDEA